MAEPLLELAGITFTYPGAQDPVLDGLDLRFGPGDRIGLFGPNGTGKTTLLHIMMGLLRQDAGEVRFGGRVVTTERDFRAVRQAIGLVLQHADDQIIYPTVLDDVAFGPLNRGLSQEAARATAVGTLAMLGLSGFEDRLAHKLSGGEKKLVSLAGVLAMEPAALLLDEPTSGLDPETRERLIHILNTLGKPCIVVSHDWDFLAQVTQRYYSIEHGRLAASSEIVLHRHVHGHLMGNLEHQHLGVEEGGHAAHSHSHACEAPEEPPASR